MPGQLPPQRRRGEPPGRGRLTLRSAFLDEPLDDDDAGPSPRGDDELIALARRSGSFGPGGSPTSPPPTVVLKVILHGSWKGDHISGTDTFQAFDGSGHLLQSGSGTFTGTRITPGK
jgi:hypothetical protein